MSQFTDQLVHFMRHIHDQYEDVDEKYDFEPWERTGVEPADEDEDEPDREYTDVD